ncbi:mediator of RNA polymerase II transcription subunit 13 [Parastagonospora nodorum]|nr:mediator of RNA polymerase II transcription subunit 13 [Parastagonospora nodorum]KAH6260100.1 mediator of RNA polymerase II transcription subunit 13 [Parastagonospora nodorum]
MEFLKTCTTNAQAIGDFEAIAYQAFSITRDTKQPVTHNADGNSSDLLRTAEAELRHGRHLVTQDASRPWLWYFKPTTVDAGSQDVVELPVVEGYVLHHEQAGFMKASEMARPPMRPGNPHAFASPATTPSRTASPNNAQGANVRTTQGGNQAGASEQQQPLDCFVVYELFASAVTALVSFFLVKDCGAVALNYRTFVSKVEPQQEEGKIVTDLDRLYWLTSVHVHWFSSGTLLVSTSTERTLALQCLGDLSEDEQQKLVDRCIRVAPNAMLASISSFDDPRQLSADDSNRRTSKKKAKMDSLEQNIEKWRMSVQRWLSRRGYSLPNLDKNSAWVTIRVGQLAQFPAMSPHLPTSARDVLWPRSLCFMQSLVPVGTLSYGANESSISPPFQDDLKWFEVPGSAGFRDPIDAAQDWFTGQLERDKILDMQRKAKKAEEDAMRRKDEAPGLYPSSPFTARTGVYGDLQPVSGVYPTPPDGIVPGTGISSTDTPSVSGTASNVVLVPGGNTPAINLSAPQDYTTTDNQQHASTSPTFPAPLEPFQTSGEDDDLFEDMEGDGFGGPDVEEADFDFFDGPDGDDVNMADAPALPETTNKPHKQLNNDVAMAHEEEHSVKEEMSDPLAALESALAAPYRPINDGMPEEKVSEKEGKAVVPVEALATSPAQIKQNPPAKKEATPPLSPSAIAKTLQPSPPKKQSSFPASLQRTNSAFHSLDFSRRLSLVDAKYQDGRFAARIEKTEDDESAVNPGRLKSLKDLPLLNKLRYAVASASTAKSTEALSLARAVSDDSASDSESETSDMSEGSPEDPVDTHPLPYLGRLIIPAKRKLPTEGHGTPLSVTSFAESLAGDWQDSNSLLLDESSLTFFEPNTWDWSIVRLPPPSERPPNGARYAIPSLPSSVMQLPDTPTSQPDLSMEPPEEKPLNGKESIAVTQILTDQIVSATLDLLDENALVESTSSIEPSSETRWQICIKELFPKAAECTLSALIAIHDVFPDLSAQAKGQQRPPPRKPNESNAIPSNHMYPMNPPFIRVRRAETHWDLLPPSIAFWEPLGLAPASPPKNVVAFCIYPHSASLRPILDRFMLNLQLAYDTCKLGSHARVETVIEYEGGLVPVKANSQTSAKEAFRALKDTCIQLGKLLAIQYAQLGEQQDTKIDAFVVYMVDPFGNPAALWELCSAFWSLFQAYGQGPPGRSDPTPKPDLVLQIIPIKYLASFDVPVILDAATYVSLAREVYDRCPPSVASTDKTPLSIYKAPAFQLEESLPRNVQFKLLSEPPQDLLRENSYMHIAYAISLDGNWLTAAWSDSCGKSQAVVSYHLGTRVFGDIAKEIWQTTIEILQARRVQWRVCIAKSGPLDREELETWVLLITCPTQVNLFLTILTVIEDPPYKFTPTTPAPSNSSAQANTNTPGSTPQTGVSPDPTIGLTPAATPSADPAPDPAADPEARLIDVTDETWGIILAHRLHNSNSTNQFSPALISGLLVKRGITHATSNSIHHPIPDPLPGPITVAVNILWIGAVGSTRAATSPFPPESPGGSAPPSPAERSTSSLMWTPTVQTRSTAENLLKEVLAQFRALGLLAKLKGMRGTRHGTVPWHIVAAKRGVEGLGRVCGTPV